MTPNVLILEQHRAILFCNNDFNWVIVDSKYLHKNDNSLFFPYFSHIGYEFFPLSAITTGKCKKTHKKTTQKTQPTKNKTPSKIVGPQ